jgi:hypothetical protein
LLNERLQEFTGVEQSASTRISFLSKYGGFSETRGLWNDEPDTQMCRIHRRQYCRGCGKHGNGEFQRYLNIAAGSASELEYHFLLSHDLNMLDETTYQHLNSGVVEVKRMLASLIRKVETERLAG